MPGDVETQLTLPSGLEIVLVADVGAPLRGPVLTAALQAFDQGRARLSVDGRSSRHDDLALADFHVLAAVLAKLAVVEEEPVTVPCHNCEASLTSRPCAELSISAWQNGEIDDPTWDALAPFGEPVDIDGVRLGRVRTARTVTLRPRTVAQARALFTEVGALVDAALVEAAGIAKLGNLEAPDAIARALATADARAWQSVQDAFIATHYPARLVGMQTCPACKARSEVDAPFHRELGPPWLIVSAHDEATSRSSFVTLETFTARAHAVAERLLPGVPGDDEPLVFVEDGTPDVDDGGNPLLGSYVPPPPAPTVTVYYQSFARAWAEEPDFDWEAELEETIEHELEHHVYFLRGADPMDDEERALLVEDERRILGAREANRREALALGHGAFDFLRRTWIVWLLVALAFVVSWWGQR